MDEEVKLAVRDVHAHVTCFLCEGYFIDATSIIECLHSFCRTCIVRYLNDNKSCPVCGVQVHKTRPLLNIRSDQTLQDIVYKLVPGLKDDEMQRRRKFWSEHSMIKMDVLKSLTPEDLGESESPVVSNKNTSRKICLSIEPYKRRNRKLDPNSNWKELDRTMTKRYIRCSYDVTIEHLQKLIRLKFKENEEVEVLMFCGEMIVPGNRTLSQVQDLFPSLMNHTLELKYSLFVPKSLKRKLSSIAWDNVNNTDTKMRNEPSLKKKKIASATPHLKAFFASQKTPKQPNKPLPKMVQRKPVQTGLNLKREPSIMEDVSAVENREDRAKIELLGMVQLQTVEKSSQKNRRLPPSNKNSSSNELNKVEDVKNGDGKTPQSKRVSPFVSKSQDSTPNKTSKHQGYAMLNISVDEAVRVKPPTPVEVPDVTPQQSKPKDPVSLPPFVRTSSLSSSSTSVPRQTAPVPPPRANRRKPTNPMHHTTKYQNHRPPSVVNQQTTKIMSPIATQQQQQPDALRHNHNNAKALPNGIPLSSNRSGQFILLQAPADNSDVIIDPSMQQRKEGIPLDKNLNSKFRLSTSSVTSSASGNVRQPLNPKLSRLSNEAAHRFALDAVRNTMGGVILKTDRKSNAGNKRPILPKAPMTSSNFTPLVRTGIDGIPQVRNLAPTRNIFQNEKITYPMGKSSIQSIPKSNPPPFVVASNSSSPRMRTEGPGFKSRLEPSSSYRPANLQFSSGPQLLNGRNQLPVSSRQTISSASIPNKPFVRTTSKILNSGGFQPQPLNNLNRVPQVDNLLHNRNGNNHIRVDEIPSDHFRAMINQRPQIDGPPFPSGDARVKHLQGQKIQIAPDPYQKTIEKTKALVRSLSQKPGPQPTSSSPLKKILPKPRHSLDPKSSSRRPQQRRLASDARILSHIKEGIQAKILGGQRKIRNPPPNQPPRARSTSRERSQAIPISVPPAGTRSPWSSRTYPLAVPDVGNSSEFQPPPKKLHLNPPKAHQTSLTPPPSALPPPRKRTPTPQPLSPDMMPLELTSRTRRSSQSSSSSLASAPTPPTINQPISDQPLCLVMKKA